MTRYPVTWRPRERSSAHRSPCRASSCLEESAAETDFLLLLLLFFWYDTSTIQREKKRRVPFRGGPTRAHNIILYYYFGPSTPFIFIPVARYPYLRRIHRKCTYPFFSSLVLLAGRPGLRDFLQIPPRVRIVRNATAGRPTATDKVKRASARYSEDRVTGVLCAAGRHKVRETSLKNIYHRGNNSTTSTIFLFNLFFSFPPSTQHAVIIYA